MGLFNDDLAANRTTWNYRYTAKDLLPHAERMLALHGQKEVEARNKSADLLRDTSVNQNDPRFNELKRSIAHHGMLKEQCAVFVHEFRRNPSEIYDLGLGDVTFFELAQ